MSNELITYAVIFGAFIVMSFWWFLVGKRSLWPIGTSIGLCVAYTTLGVLSLLWVGVWGEELKSGAIIFTILLLVLGNLSILVSIGGKELKR